MNIVPSETNIRIKEILILKDEKKTQNYWHGKKIKQTIGRI